MKFLLIRTRFVVLAAYLLAAIMPAVMVAGQSPPARADHERMMAMAGHVAQMPGMDGPADIAQNLLCQQHCMVAVAMLPTASHAPERSAVVDPLVVVDAAVAVSHSSPPPGPPPKVAPV